MLGLVVSGRADDFAAELPSGVRADWNLADAFRETTPTREKVCLNGLWRWQPADAMADQVPPQKWGFFKVPGSWPGITDYMQKDSQTLFRHPVWKDFKIGEAGSAWYEREIEVPAQWSNRKIALSADYLNSFASVFVDGAKAGELHFPGGELDLTGVCRPGGKHRLSILVVALPLKGVLLSYTDSASAREVKGSVARRGLCGDVFLVSEPKGPTFGSVQIDTSVRRGELSVAAAINGLEPNGRYLVQARIIRDRATQITFNSPPFQTTDLVNGHIIFTNRWMPDRLWDIHTSTNKYDLELTLQNPNGEALDIDWTHSFGFREFWIQGRDFYLNGKRIFLSAVPLDNAQVSAAASTYEAASESLRRLKAFGINYVYTHNYGCEPGAHLSFGEILRAADDVGMLVGFTQPHFSHYDWKAPDSDANKGYARHAAFYAEAAGNHPSVVMYVMSHNATGYEEDMNPDMIDGIHDGRDQWAARNVKLAERAEAIVKGMDPRRIVYHHASGNLGVMHDSNFYPNFAPIQELDDWFGHWAAEGIKPAFTCEYGAPFTWDWTMYRGWYKGQREWGSAVVPWEFCLAEWNAQFIGDSAYRISDLEKTNLRWEAKQFRAGKVWHRWDYPNQVGSDRFDERYPIFARYITDNWRAYRTWGVSGISPWEYEHFWKLRPGVDKGRKELPVDWDHLQRPGFSADYLDQRYERVDMAFEPSDWIATPAAEALIRNNRPLLAYIAGKAGAFTGKDHNFRAGETVEKQIIVINNSRESVACNVEWSSDVGEPNSAKRRETIGAGDQARIPIRFVLPENQTPGSYAIKLIAKFDDGESQDDRFAIDVLPAKKPDLGLHSGNKIALWDPKGETSKLLDSMGVKTHPIGASDIISDDDILIVGKGALTVEGSAPDISRVRDGLKLILFEQESGALEKRLGFRVEEYGLRQLFPRTASHPALAGLTTENLRDWRGSATLTAPQLKYEMRPRYGPTVEWAGIPVTRVWRCGNRGNVASALIEKPARGDFFPILDGGFSLQFSPLLEYREGKGMMLFCQSDVTGRTEDEPAAATLAANIINHIRAWKPLPHRHAIYIGESAGKSFLDALGVTTESYTGSLPADSVLIAGPGCGKMAGANTSAIADFTKSGGRLLAIGLDQEEVTALLPFPITLRKAEHISSYFEPFATDSLLAGIGSADVHNRDPRELPLVESGAKTAGDGVLAVANGGNTVLFQMAPWQLQDPVTPNLKRTFRHASVLLARLLGNMGVEMKTPLVERFHSPVAVAAGEKRYLNSFYLDRPEEWDDPYRFFRW